MNNNSNQAVKSVQNMSHAELLAKVAELEAKVAAKSNRELSAKISENTGAIVINGFGRFPVTLYGAQVDKLIAFVPSLKAFREKYSANLSTKDLEWDAKTMLAGVPEEAISRIKAKKEEKAN